MAAAPFVYPGPVLISAREMPLSSQKLFSGAARYSASASFAAHFAPGAPYICSHSRPYPGGRRCSGSWDTLEVKVPPPRPHRWKGQWDRARISRKKHFRIGPFLRASRNPAQGVIEKRGIPCR